jgi:hypothetical protein
VGKRKHGNSAVVEQYKERAPGFLVLGKVHTVLSRQFVELAPVPWVWPDPNAWVNVEVLEELNVLGKYEKKIDWAATRWAVGHLLWLFGLATYEVEKTRASSETNEDLEYR